MTGKALLSLGFVVLIAGCASSDEKITFSDEPQIRQETAVISQPVPAQKRLEKADELKIEQAIFSYLLERHFWDAGDYSAVFLQTDDAQVDTLIRKYPGHVPPVKQSYHALIEAHRTPLDKDTGKPAMILNVDINEPNADNSVDAIGRWYAGDAVTGFRMIHLNKVGNDWQIADVKEPVIDK